MNCKPGLEDGFSLVEILVAFAVLAGTLIVGFRIFGDGLNRIASGRDRLIIADALRSQITRLQSDRQLKIGESRGTNDGVRWVASISAIGTLHASTPYSVFPLRLRVAEDDPSGGGQVLETIIFGFQQQ